MFSLTCAGTSVQSRSEQVDHRFSFWRQIQHFQNVYRRMDHDAGFGNEAVLSRSRNSFIGLLIANSHYFDKRIKTLFFCDCNDL